MELKVDEQNLEMCRLCANVYPVDSECTFISLFEPNDGIQHELNFIQTHINNWELKISPNDGLPQRACANCFLTFYHINEFRKKCEEAQNAILASILRDCNTNGDENPGDMSFLQLPDALLEHNNQLMQTMETQQQQQQQNEQQQQLAVAEEEIMMQQHQTIISNVDNNVADINLNDLENNLAARTTTTSAHTIMTSNLNENQMFISAAQFNPHFTDESAQSVAAITGQQQQQQQQFYINNQPFSVFDPAASKKTANNCSIQPVDIYGDADVETVLTGSLIMTKKHIAKAVDAADENNTQLQNTSENITRTATTTTAGTTLSSEKVSKPNETDNAIMYDDECLEEDVPNSRVSTHPFACQYCYCSDTGSIDHIVFSDDAALGQHLLQLHNPKMPYNCPECARSFKTAYMRNAHMRVQHAQMQRDSGKCEYCGKSIRMPHAQHQNTNCSYTQDWFCNICQSTFNNMQLHRFRAHERTHDAPKMHYCSFCNRAFVRKANKEAHERTHKTSSEMMSCDQCEANFYSSFDLNKHKYTMHQGEMPCKCAYCNKGFASNSFLARHVQLHHAAEIASAELALKCDNCDIMFPTLHKLKLHEQLPRDENGKCVALPEDPQERRRLQRQGILSCHLCSKRFHIKAQLERHLHTHDARLRPFNCEQCSMRFRSKFELKHHTDVTHLNNKPFECQVCGKSFGAKRDINEHLLSHKDANIKCSEENCNYVAKNEKILNNHLRQNHGTYPCEYCKLLFTQQNLRTHMRNVHRQEIYQNHAETEAAVRSLSLLNESKPIENEQTDNSESYFDILNGDLLESEQEIIIT